MEGAADAVQSSSQRSCSSGLAALPPHSAENLWLSGTTNYLPGGLRLRSRGVASDETRAHNGKAKPYRTVLRQSRYLTSGPMVNELCDSRDDARRSSGVYVPRRDKN